MPFTIGGDWIPNEEKKNEKNSSKPVKVRKVKRKKALLTVILNLTLDEKELKDLATRLKRLCGSGGTIRDGVIEVQGDHVERIRTELKSQGIRAQ